MPKLKADLDLHKLEIFYWVAELKSFSQAAELLSLRQPTVSAHVQELEKAHIEENAAILAAVKTDMPKTGKVVAFAR